MKRANKIDRSSLKRCASSRGPATTSSCSTSSLTVARRPSVHAVGDVVASGGFVSLPQTLPSSAGAPSTDSTRGVVALPRCLERLLYIDSVAVRSAMDRSLVKVHLANGCFNVFKCSDSTTVKDVVDLAITRLAHGQRFYRLCYALRMIHPKSGELHWLQEDWIIGRCRQQFESSHPGEEWRYELHVRFLPKDLRDLFSKDPVTFYYLFDQVKKEYKEKYWNKIDRDLAVQLGCLDIRLFFKDMQHKALEKKSNIEYLEQIGWQQFLPKFVIEGIPSKSLRKMVQQAFKQFAQWPLEDCVMKFYEKLSPICRFDIERFPCALGLGWSVPIELLVGSAVSISYQTDRLSSPTFIADFSQVQSVLTHVTGSGRDAKHHIQIRIAGALEPLAITCSSAHLLDHLASLIDGYCCLINGDSKPSVWKRTDDDDSLRALTVTSNADGQLKVVKHSVHDSALYSSYDLQRISDYADIDNESEYCSISSNIFEIEPCFLRLDDIIGEGQFGDVYRGTYTTPDGVSILVAVKTCKSDDDPTRTDQLLKEAGIMHQFDHSNIIKLIGVCPSSPMSIVMELAEFGEMRAYLHTNRNQLPMDCLVLYCYQLAMAVSYLESKKFVHRDIAARNVLVSAEDCVKLADFGLSRFVEEQNYYKASKGKLPIKWMAPESINFRRFTSCSDVWMLAVCMWEVLTYGIKPFQGVRNSAVIDKIEAGERLPLPPTCPPPALYNLMCACWSYDSSTRPSASEVKMRLSEIYEEECARKEYERRNESRKLKTMSTLWDLPDGATPPPKPTWPGTKISSSGSTPNLLSATSLSTPTSAAGLAHQHWSSTTVLPMSRRPAALPDQCRQTYERSPAVDTAPLSFVQQSFQAPARLSVPLQLTADSVPADNHVAEASSSLLAEKLQKQKMQSEEDARWLQQEEENLVLREMCSPSLDEEDGNTEELAVNRGYNRFSMTSSDCSPDDILPEQSSLGAENVMTKEALQQIELDRTNDAVYSATTDVARVVIDMIRGVQQAQIDKYVELVKNVGAELKTLMVSVDAEIVNLPLECHTEIRMAHQVLSSDMAQLISAMRLAQQYGSTLLDSTYRKSMLQAAHVIAVDSKHLLETVDDARRRLVARTRYPGVTFAASPASRLPDTHTTHEKLHLGVPASSAVL